MLPRLRQAGRRIAPEEVGQRRPAEAIQVFMRSEERELAVEHDAGLFENLAIGCLA